MIFTFKALGIEEAKVRFNRLGAAAIDLAPAWAEILQYFYWIEDATFQSQGRRGGGSWAEDSEDWLAQKARMGLDPRINFATWALYDAMTLPDAPGQKIHMTPASLEVGSDLPQAGPSQQFRTFVKLTPQDRVEFAELMKRHFIRAWNERV
jgi:hypothetical protein